MQLFKVYIVFVLLFSFFACQRDRYYLHTDGDRIYKIDKRTGDTWLVVGTQLRKVNSISSDGNKNDPENQVIELAKSARTFFDPDQKLGTCSKCQSNFSTHHDNEICIRNFLRKEDGMVQIKGWRVPVEKNGIYLAEFQWSKDDVDHSYIFEINLGLRRVRNLETMEQRVYFYPDVAKYMKRIYRHVSYVGSYEEFEEAMDNDQIRYGIWEEISEKENVSYTDYQKYLRVSVN